METANEHRLKQQTAVVIGGGAGGLFTAAILSRLGWKVTVLEKNVNIGGGLQTFSRAGVPFSPGMHLVGGLGKGGAADRFLSWLGVEAAKTEVCQLRVKMLSESLDVEIPQGFEAFERRLSELFPKSADEIHAYILRIREIYESVPLLRLEAGIFTPEGDALLPSDEFLSKYISDERLRGVLSFLNPLSGAEAGRTPAFISAIINSLYISGAYRFKDGTLPLVKSLKKVIESSGGEVIGGCAATAILSDPLSKKVTGVKAANGMTYSADTYISDISPLSLLSLCPEDAFPKVFRRRVLSQSPGISMFCVYVKLSVPLEASSAEFILPHPDSAWKSAEQLLITSEGRSLTIMTPLLPSGPWKPGSEEYKKWKAQRAEEILSRAEEAFPALKSNIEAFWAATPSTIARYLTPDGSAYGFSVDCSNPLFSRFGPKTYLHNLFQTGQSVFLHGFCGVMMSALLSCREIVGEKFDEVLKDIHQTS